MDENLISFAIESQKSISDFQEADENAWDQTESYTVGENGEVYISIDEGAEVNGEVLVYDEESGECQKFVYLPDSEKEPEPEKYEVTEECVTIETFQEDNTESYYVIQVDNAEEFSETEQLSQTLLHPIQVETNVLVPKSPKQQKPTYPKLYRHRPKPPEEFVQCGDCQRVIKLSDFPNHYQEVHQQSFVNASEPNVDQHKVCSICGKMLSKKDYLEHFKEAHSSVRLGCPRCPKIYETPEQLNQHFKIIHCKKTVQENSTLSIQPEKKPASKNVKSRKASSENVKSSLGSSFRKSTLNMFSCEVCSKSYSTQRDFTNHKRRKGFCKPPIVEEEPQPKRRIGIIRRIL